MALDLYRTAAQIDAAVAGAELGSARDRRAEVLIAALRDADGADAERSRGRGAGIAGVPASGGR